MTAEPIARVVDDIRRGRFRSVLKDAAVNRTASERARRIQPVVDTTAFYDSLVAKDEDIDVYGDHPCIAPPWNDALFCYVNEHGNVVVNQMTASPWPAGLEWETPNTVDWAGLRWRLDVFVWVGGHGADGRVFPTTGPLHLMQFAVTPDGTPADLHWVHLVPDYPMERWTNAQLVVLQSLNFLSCRNVELVEPKRPRPLRRRLERLGVGVGAIVVRPVGKRSRAANGTVGLGELMPVTSVRGHFACVDEETQILTRSGWRTHAELQVGDEVAGYDLDTGISGWTRCHGVHRFKYDGPMVAVECRALSMKLTPNHRAVVTKSRRLRQAPEIVKAAELRPKHMIPRSLKDWREDGREKAIGLDVARLCGWIAAEGHVRPDGWVGLCQSSTVNAQHVASIDELLSRITLPPANRSARRRKYDSRPPRINRRVEPDGMIRWTLPLGLSQMLLGLLPGKQLPDWFSDLPLVEAEAVLQSFIDGDGHRHPGERVVVAQRVRDSLDVLQAIAVRLGWKTSLRFRPGSTSTAVWRLTLSRGPDASLRRSDGSSLVANQSHRGLVWCPTTGTGTFVARRDGHVFVTGNSYGEQYGKGKLFGKLEGRFWVPAFARGVAAGKAPAQRDYVLKP
jgi:hypothetical protein